MIGLSLGLALGTQGGVSSPIETLAARAATVAVYDWPRPGTMTAGDGGIVVQGDSDTIATVPNYKTPGTWDQAQGTASFRPIYDNGAVIDGSNDTLAIALPVTRPANATLIMIVKSADKVDSVIIGTSNTANYIARATDASGSASNAGMGTLTFRKNGAGVTVSTRDQMADQFLDGAANVLTAQGVNLSNVAFNTIYIGQTGATAAASNASGRLLFMAVLDAAQADYATALAEAEALAAAQIVELGL